MQGVIYGPRTPEITDDALLTRFDFDETWGTALNRVAVEAVLGLPITPYGKGGQVRGFLALEDSMQSLRLAIENPAKSGEYRVFNQFDAAYTINDLAELTHRVARDLGLNPRIEHPPDPRVEAEQHYYNPIHENLPALGYKRSRNLEEVLREIFKDLIRFRRRLEKRRHVVMPTVDWRQGDNTASLVARSHPTSTAEPTAPAPAPTEDPSRTPA
jgi:UDP-sulfoquinovose synthase